MNSKLFNKFKKRNIKKLISTSMKLILIVALLLPVNMLGVGVGGDVGVNKVYANGGIFDVGDGTSESPYEITTWEQLNEVRNYLDSHFILMNNLDISSAGYDTYASATANKGRGWVPIGSFNGTLDGGGKYIADLTITGAATTVDAAFFTSISSTGVIKNLNLGNANILSGNINPTSAGSVAILAAQNEGHIENVSVQTNHDGYGDSIVGNASLDVQHIGGLVARNFGTITNAHAGGTKVIANLASHSAGGLVGQQFYGSIEQSSSHAIVTVGNGSSNVGGLVGSLLNSNLERSRVIGDGDITGGNYVGGLVGRSYHSHIEQSFRQKTLSELIMWVDS